MMEFIESINWGMVFGVLTIFSFGPIFCAPVTRIMFWSEYGHGKGEDEWFKFTLTFMVLFFIGIAGVWYFAP